MLQPTGAASTKHWEEEHWGLLGNEAWKQSSAWLAISDDLAFNTKKDLMFTNPSLLHECSPHTGSVVGKLCLMMANVKTDGISSFNSVARSFWFCISLYWYGYKNKSPLSWLRKQSDLFLNTIVSALTTAGEVSATWVTFYFNVDEV